MPRAEEEIEDNHEPSKLALQNSREIGELTAVSKNLAAGLQSLGREMADGFAKVDRNIERMADRVNRPPDKSLWVAIVGVLLTFLLGVGAMIVAGVPIIAGLIYFVDNATVAPLNERLGKVEQSVEVSKAHEWDNFELMVRSDQVLIDRNLKTNDTDTSIRVPKLDRKNKKP